MRSLNKFLIFSKSIRWINRQIRIYIIIIFYCIRRACTPFDYFGVIIRDTYIFIITYQSVMRNSCIPNMCNSKFFNLLQSCICYIFKFSYSVLFFCSPRNVFRFFITKKTCKNLIDYFFLRNF